MTSAELRILGGLNPSTLLLQAADAMAELERDNARMCKALDRLVSDARADAEEAEQRHADYAAEFFAGEIEGKVVPLRPAPRGGVQLWDEPA